MPQVAQQYPYIVADIGGTNARFGLVTDPSGSQGYQLAHQQTFPSQSFDGIESAVATYRQSISDIKVGGACLAVAGPVAGEEVCLTNLSWQFNIGHIQNSLALPKLEIINDFAAYAYAIRHLPASFTRDINPGEGIAGAPVAVLGPGTGFGVAALISQGQQATVLASEGGHMALAANTPLQSALKEQLSRRFNLVSIERVFSGPGLRHLYHALAAVEGKTSEELRTSEISERALTGADELCTRTLQIFCSWLGAVTGDLALALGARGGVYLGGGILPRIADFLLASDFADSFRNKDQMSHFLEAIPVKLVTEGNSALLGAAAWFEDHCLPN